MTGIEKRGALRVTCWPYPAQHAEQAWAHACRGRPLRGVLFWRWDMQVYAGTDPADYGVRLEDTTFDLIRQNADQLKILSAQQPPNAACRVGCWVPEVHAGTFSTVNRCALALRGPSNMPVVSCQTGTSCEALLWSLSGLNVCSPAAAKRRAGAIEGCGPAGI